MTNAAVPETEPERFSAKEETLSREKVCHSRPPPAPA